MQIIGPKLKKYEYFCLNHGDYFFQFEIIINVLVSSLCFFLNTNVMGVRALGPINILILPLLDRLYTSESDVCDSDVQRRSPR